MAGLCAECGVAAPETSLDAARRRQRLAGQKRGGAGGAMSPRRGGARDGEKIYFQRGAPGRPCPRSPRRRRRREIARFQRAMARADAGEPFRFGGCGRPIAPPPAAVEAMRAAVDSLTRAARARRPQQRSTFSSRARTWLIEINPRPGATLDMFEPTAGCSGPAHIDACRGRLPDTTAPRSRSARAARSRLRRARHRGRGEPEWPDWAADRPLRGGAVPRARPIHSLRGGRRRGRGARSRGSPRARHCRDDSTWESAMSGLATERQLRAAELTRR